MRNVGLRQHHSGSAIPRNIGDELAVTVTNGLDRPTSVRWHGIALRNDMDGAAPATPNIESGREFAYRFSSRIRAPTGRHPHTGLDTDYGLAAPVIVDDPSEPARYDAEWIVVLDDWTDGVGKSPQDIYTGLHHGMTGMGGWVASAPATCWAVTPATAAIPTTSSTAYRRRPLPSPPSPVSEFGSG